MFLLIISILEICTAQLGGYGNNFGNEGGYGVDSGGAEVSNGGFGGGYGNGNGAGFGGGYSSSDYNSGNFGGTGYGTDGYSTGDNGGEGFGGDGYNNEEGYGSGYGDFGEDYGIGDGGFGGGYGTGGYGTGHYGSSDYTPGGFEEGYGSGNTDFGETDYGGGFGGGFGDYGNPGTNPWNPPLDPEIIKCSNSTIELKTNWTLPPGSFEAGTTCIYKIKIPADSYAIVEILQGSQPEQWYKFDNALGYSFLSPVSSVPLDSPEIYGLPPLEAEFFLINPENFLPFSDRTALRIFKVTRRKLNFTKIQNYNLTENVLFSPLNDIFKQDTPIRLLAKNTVWLKTVCNSSAPVPWGVENAAKYWSTVPQNIFIFKENGTKRILVDTLHSLYFNTKTYQSPVLLYPSVTTNNSPCSILARDNESKQNLEDLPL